MKFQTEKRSYEILQMVINNKKYSDIVKKFQRSLGELQQMGQNFSEEQWEAVHNYLNAFTKLHLAMMDIALQDKNDAEV